MTSEHNWSLPSISIGLGKNSVKEVIKRGKQLSKSNVVNGSSNNQSKSEITPAVTKPTITTKVPKYSYTPGNV